MPRWITPVLLTVTVLALVPPFLIARARVAKSRETRIHPLPDMDNQSKFKAQATNLLFSDRRAMRPPVAGTVARGELRLDSHFFRGEVDGGWARGFPPRVTVDAAFMARGRERFGIYCAPCHGLSGRGDGIVPARTENSDSGAWVVTDLTSEVPRGYEVGHLFNIVSYGIKTMPPYRFQIPTEDRWAIVAYVRALQRSQHATLDDVPPGGRAELEARKRQILEERQRKAREEESKKRDGEGSGGGGKKGTSTGEGREGG